MNNRSDLTRWMTTGILGEGSTPPPPYVEPNFTVLASIFDNMAAIEPSRVWQDVDGTIPVTHGSVVKAIDDIKGGAKVKWNSNDFVRKSYFLPKYGSMKDLQRGIYLHPAGDRPYLFIPNILDFVFDKAITPHASPNTLVFVYRNKRAVFDENLTPASAINYKQQGNGLIASGNNGGGGFVEVIGSNHPAEDVWTAVYIVDNGASSRLYYNNVANGNAFTLVAGTIDLLGFGTTSHVLECDLAFIGEYKGAMSSGDRITVQSQLASIYAIGQKPTRPFAENISVGFNGIDTFTASYTYNDGGTGIPEDTSLRVVEFFCLDTSTSPDGYTGLDNIKVIWGHNALTLVRKDFPSYFFSPGTGNIQVGVRIKAYGIGGVHWDGIPLRSNTISDNIAGTPGTPVPSLASATIEDSDKNRFILTFTGGSGTIDNTTGLTTDFKVFIDDVEVAVTAIAFPGGQVMHVDIASDIESTNTARIQMLRGADPLKDTNGALVEQFVTGPIIAVENNIVGPITANLNFTWFVDTALPGWNNYTYDMAVLGVIDDDVPDEEGVNSGITAEVSDVWGGFIENTVGQTNADFPDSNITKRGFSLWSGGQNQGAIKLSGFNPGQAVDIKAALLVDTGGTATTSVTVIGATTQAYTGLDVSTLQQVNCSTTANASGEVTVQVNTTSGGVTQLCALIFIKYP